MILELPYVCTSGPMHEILVLFSRDFQLMELCQAKEVGNFKDKLAVENFYIITEIDDAHPQTTPVSTIKQSTAKSAAFREASPPPHPIRRSLFTDYETTARSVDTYPYRVSTTA